MSPVTSSARADSTGELLRFLLMMAASKPTSRLSVPSHIVSHLACLWGLSRRSGLFSSRLRTLAPAVCLPGDARRYSRFAPCRYPVTGPSRGQCPTPGGSFPRRYLNSFRGEPDITRFDWPFTPRRRSSPDFATSVGRGLQRALPRLHPAHA